MGCKEHPFSKQGAGRIPHPDFSLGGFGYRGTGLRGTGGFVPFGAAVPDGQAGPCPGTCM